MQWYIIYSIYSMLHSSTVQLYNFPNRSQAGIISSNLILVLYDACSTVFTLFKLNPCAICNVYCIMYNRLLNSNLFMAYYLNLILVRTMYIYCIKGYP